MENERTKMCPICNGTVAIDVSLCPYCATNLYETLETSNDQKTSEDVKSLSYEETLASLYPPPYKPKVIETNSFENDADQNIEENSQDVIEEKSALIPTILFWTGVNLFLFSLILLFFANGAYLHLQIRATYWFLYAICALPFIYLGFVGLQKLD